MGRLPEYDYSIDVQAPVSFRTTASLVSSRSYIKAILCLFAYQQPKSFIEKRLHRAYQQRLAETGRNSKNYHHFFPRGYLQKVIEPWDPRINHVANVTIVDDYLNKRKIRDRSPSDYMSDFKVKKNEKLAQTMQTHLIDVETFGVWNDDFDTFFRKRCERIGEELSLPNHQPPGRGKRRR